MKPEDAELAQHLVDKIRQFHDDILPLPGILTKGHLMSLVGQMIDSIRRVRYIEVLRSKNPGPLYADPYSEIYDPIKAAIWNAANMQIEEAFWQVFLATHFGKNKYSGWNLARAVYKGAPTGIWTWQNISQNFLTFQIWLQENLPLLKATGAFGNHRKYQSLDAYSLTGTGMAMGSYIDFISRYNSHQGLIDFARQQVGDNPKELFSFIYGKMADVISFGRTARFDYLTMVGKLQLAPLRPDSAYIENATGPKRGANLLFGGHTTARMSNPQLKSKIQMLEEYIELDFGMQVIEDALCNWQKNPAVYRHFKG